MKLKTLFLSMLGAAAIVSCNNDSVIGGPDGSDGSGGGESTTATFQLNFINPGTYAGSDTISGTGRENGIDNAALFIYKLDGTPEAMAYLVGSDYSTNSGKVTVKCKSGDKLIYLAANTGGTKLIKYAANTTNANDPYTGVDWNIPNAQGPKFSVTNLTNNGTITLYPLNSAIWSASDNAIVIDSTSVSMTSINGNADGLIKALTGNGNPANGHLIGDGGGNINSYYLMSNWGDATTQPTDAVAVGDSYLSTVKFNLKPNVPAADSRAATADATNSSGKNALLINIQRAVAKVSVAFDSGVTSDAGEGTSHGVFAPDTKWAIGNINTSTYPFQMWDGSIVKSTRYDDNVSILPAANNGNWSKKMDNTRITGTGMSYENQNLSASLIVGGGTINSNSANQSFGVSNYALVTENNQRIALNHYLTFVTFAGQYKPDSLITNVNDVGQVTGNNKQFPTSSEFGAGGGKDTIYYVGSLGSNGLFFWGLEALQKYVCYVLNIHTGSSPYTPTSDTEVANYINGLRVPAGNVQADLQAYWHGYCFYRVWITDDAATAVANKKLVRRNHVYQVTINKIKGPGIGDPNDIIDPDPTTIEPTEEADTYVTATVNVMKWHIIKQSTEIDLN
jgi:hypothetical protein